MKKCEKKRGLEVEEKGEVGNRRKRKKKYLDKLERVREKSNSIEKRRRRKK